MGGWRLIGSQFLERVLLGKRGVTSGRSKRLPAKMFFSVITKNLSWEVLTKWEILIENLVTFKDEKFSYYEGH